MSGCIDILMFRMVVEVVKVVGNVVIVEDEMNNQVVFKRKGQLEEVVVFVVFLLSDEVSYIIGIVISVDGGWVCQRKEKYRN